MAMSGGKLGTRTKAAQCSADTTLACLPLKELMEIWEQYPIVKDLVSRREN